MSRQEDIKAPPPGPIQPIFNDPLTQIERERRMLRYRASQLTSPEEQENVKSAAGAFGAREGKVPGLGGNLKRAPQPKKRVAQSPIKNSVTLPTPIGAQFLPKTIQQSKQPQTMSKNLIVPVNAQGAPVADTRPQEQAPQLKFIPAPDGTFCKVADRPRPANHPLNQPWTQKFLATHENHPFAIVKDENIAKLLCDALNVYFHAAMQQQAEQAAAQRAAASAANDASAFDAPIPEVVEETDALTGAAISEVGEPSAIEQLPTIE